jgi:iron complex transport system ATP-binding protein
MLKAGEIFAAGTPQAVLTPEGIRSVYEVEVAINYSNNTPYIMPIVPLQ